MVLERDRSSEGKVRHLRGGLFNPRKRTVVVLAVEDERTERHGHSCVDRKKAPTVDAISQRRL